MFVSPLPLWLEHDKAQIHGRLQCTWFPCHTPHERTSARPSGLLGEIQELGSKGMKKDVLISYLGISSIRKCREVSKEEGKASALQNQSWTRLSMALINKAWYYSLRPGKISLISVDHPIYFWDALTFQAGETSNTGLKSVKKAR